MEIIQILNIAVLIVCGPALIIEFISIFQKLKVLDRLNEKYGYKEGQDQ